MPVDRIRSCSLPIALLTDFGYRDAYVGVMRGVILARCPDARLFDLTHGIPPQDILTGALQLASAVAYWPEETLFLAVVDPGVGGERRPICIRSGRRLFVGPDNGLLWPAAVACGEPEAFHLDRAEVWLPDVSATFHGRDIFAPVAAALAAGVGLESLGTPISDPVRLELPRPERRDGALVGEVLMIDGFGNAVTNLRPADLEPAARRALRVRVAGIELRGPASHYAAVPPGAPVLLVGSLGFYEIAVHAGNAAERYGIRRGDPVEAIPETDPAAEHAAS